MQRDALGQRVGDELAGGGGEGGAVGVAHGGERRGLGVHVAREERGVVGARVVVGASGPGGVEDVDGVRGDGARVEGAGPGAGGGSGGGHGGLCGCGAVMGSGGQMDVPRLCSDAELVGSRARVWSRVYNGASGLYKRVLPAGRASSDARYRYWIKGDGRRMGCSGRSEHLDGEERSLSGAPPAKMEIDVNECAAWGSPRGGKTGRLGWVGLPSWASQYYATSGANIGSDQAAAGPRATRLLEEVTQMGINACHRHGGGPTRLSS